MPTPTPLELIPAGHRELVAARVLARRLFTVPKADALYEWMREPNVRTAVLTDADGVLGFVTWDNETIFGLGLDPSRRGEGLARRLMQHAMDPPRPMFLQVGLHNTPAQALYRSLGFLPQPAPSGDDGATDHYEDGTPFLRMHRPLQATMETS